jgi:hypothetical protein
MTGHADQNSVKYFLLSAPVDWQPDQLIRRFLLPTGDYVSCVLWLVRSADDTEPPRETDH